MAEAPRVGFEQAKILGVERARDDRAVGREHELQAREGTREGRNHDALPSRMQVQTDLVDEHDAAAVRGVVLVSQTRAQMVEEVAEQADVAAIAVRERREADLHAATLEQVLVPVEFAGKAGVSGNQPVNELADTPVEPGLVALELWQPTGHRRERDLLLEQARHALVAERPLLAAPAW